MRSKNSLHHAGHPRVEGQRPRDARSAASSKALATRYRVSLLVVQLYSGVPSKLAPALEAMCERTVILPAGSPAQPVFRARRTSIASMSFAWLRFRFSIPEQLLLAKKTQLQLDLDDIESKAARRLAALQGMRGECVEADRLEQLENDAFRRFHRVFVCSRADQEEIAAAHADGNPGIFPT